MNKVTKPAPLTSLETLMGDGFPDEVVLVYFEKTKLHMCYYTNTIHGVAVFSTGRYAIKFMERIVSPHYVLIFLSFDEAREVAKSKGPLITALHLLDDIEHPISHFVA